MTVNRSGGRKRSENRQLQAELDFIAYPEGSVLFSMGSTRVLCNASIEEEVPRWMKQQDLPGGWITAEYAMLPRATHTRSVRETVKLSSRSQEIRRLVGRSLRAAVKLEKLPAITCIIDCDVLQADGGTRTASISGGYIALVLALYRYQQTHHSPMDVYRPAVAAVSAGVVEGEVLVDLDYREDSSADFDLNVVMNARHSLIEVQGTAEAGVIERDEFVAMLELAEESIDQIQAFQFERLSEAGVDLPDTVWGK